MEIHKPSFINCLCFLMMLGVMLHVFTRDASTRVVQEIQDHLESTYCKFPQTQKLDETKSCSSVHHFFFRLGNGCSYRKESREVDALLAFGSFAVKEEKDWDNFKEHINMEESTYESDVRMEDADGKDEKETNKDGEGMSSALVDSFVICLLLFSASVSLMEWYKERKRNTDQQAVGEGLPPGEGENAPATPGNRRFSLADLAVNRHIRRKETHRHQMMKQTSTGAVVRPGFQPPPLLRRSSFPARFPEVRSRQAPQRQQSHPGVPPSRRMSVDLVDDDSSPDRRRVRIIRRH